MSDHTHRRGRLTRDLFISRTGHRRKTNATLDGKGRKFSKESGKAKKPTHSKLGQDQLNVSRGSSSEGGPSAREVKGPKVEGGQRVQELVSKLKAKPERSWGVSSTEEEYDHNETKFASPKTIKSVRQERGKW